MSPSLRRWCTALAIAALLLTAVLYVEKYNGHVELYRAWKSTYSFFVWATLTVLAIVGSVLRYLVGPNRFDKFCLTLIQRLAARSPRDE